MNELDIVLAIIGIVLIIVLIVWGLREVSCWYFKINERIELQKEHNDLLKSLLIKLEDIK